MVCALTHYVQALTFVRLYVYKFRKNNNNGGEACAPQKENQVMGRSHKGRKYS